MLDVLQSLQQRPCSWDGRAFAESLEAALQEDDEDSQASLGGDGAPQELSCPLSGMLMADPVIVESGQSYERNCIQSWLDQGEKCCYRTGNVLKTPSLIPNVALKSAIANWCKDHKVPQPRAPSLAEARQIVRDRSSSSEEFSGSRLDSASDFSDNRAPSSPQQRSTVVEVDRLTKSLRSSSSRVTEQQGHAAWELRELARNAENRRALCQEPLLKALLPLLHSTAIDVQRNAMAAVVNLSLDKSNKVPIARAGLIPPVVHLLGSRDAEVQENAAAAIFSLAALEENRSAIGVLGAVPPLIEIVRRAESRQQAKQDATMALYYLSQSQINRGKIVKCGGGAVLLEAAEAGGGELARRAMCILSSLAAAPDGRAALLECGGVPRILALLKAFLAADGGGAVAAEQAVAALVDLSQRNFRFKHQAMQAGGRDMLRAAMVTASSPGFKDKMLRLLSILEDAPGSHSSSISSPSSSSSLPSPFLRACIRRSEREAIRGRGDSAPL